MRVHHLNCVSACPLGGFVMDGMSIESLRARLTSHCLLLELADTLVLIDTGYGLRDVADPRSRLSGLFLTLLRPELREEMTAVRQIERLGYSPRDVRHIVLSHLDFDHAGGLDDFPDARVHLLADEVASASGQRTLLDRLRYRPEQWSTRADWQTYASTRGEKWLGFQHAQQLVGVSPDILLVPLIGHTLGHAGVAIRVPNGWLLYAADAYFYHQEMALQNPHCTPGLAVYQTIMEKDRASRLLNQKRLRELKQAQGSAVQIFCAHDVREFEQLSGVSHRRPVPSGQPIVAPRFQPSFS
jgi:glyoxylase-like metal-dependent hydrolase (beta-lactamase superfamily II)